MQHNLYVCLLQENQLKETVLAELIVEAIVLLENSRVNIHSVIADGTTTNKKFWSLIGISGKKMN